MESVSIGALKAYPITPHLGVRVENLDPNIPISNKEIVALTSAINKYCLVHLRSDSMVNPESHIALTKQLGDPWSYGFTEGQYKEYPEIFKVSNQRGKGFTNAGQAWHSDGSIYNKAMHLSLFAIKQIPDDGAYTFFTNLSYALQRLSPNDLEKLRHTQADYGKQYEPHPVVWKHPLTGSEVLHVSEGIKARFVDTKTGQHYSPEENVKIEGMLHELLWQDETFYRHEWQPGDLLIGDNYAIAHYAKPSNSNTLRVLHRTATKGVNRRKFSEK